MLDIHTHREGADAGGKSIINYQLLAEPPFVDGHYYSIGVHPWYLSADTFVDQIDWIAKQLPDKRIVAIGEAGLDKLAEAPMEFQSLAFRMQVALAERYKLPLIIHCVKAMDELLVVRRDLKPVQPWVWHGFRGKPEQALQLLAHGFYLSFGEFYADETMRSVPADRLFLETDNSEIGIEELLWRAARIRGVETDALRDTISQNIRNVFFRAPGVASSEKESYFCPFLN